MSSRFTAPFFDAGSGIKPSDGAKLFFFDAGTSTPRDTFSDQLATPTPNSNPVIADSKGVFSDIFIGGAYKVVLKDKNDVQIWEADPVDSLTQGGLINEASITAAIAAGVSGSTGDFVETSEYNPGTGYGGHLYQLTNIDPGFLGTGNHVRDDGLFLKILTDDETHVLHFGAKLDGSNSDLSFAAFLQSTGNLKMPAAASGQLYITSLPDLSTINGGDRIVVSGAGLEETVLQVTQAAPGILFDNFKVFVKFAGFTVQEVDAAGGNTTILGKCFDSSASGAAFVLWDDLRTIGFNIVGEVRQSIWCNIGALECTAYGLKPLSFVLSLKDGSPPTVGWNLFPNGWFNNSLTVKNYLARNGINGPVFEGSSISIDSLTTEGLTGDGVFIRGNSSVDKSHLVTIQNLYQENVAGTLLQIKNVDNLIIENYFQQGRDMSTPSIAVLNADEAKVTINAVFGQDWFTNGAILSNNSSFFGEVSGAIIGGDVNKYVIDSTSFKVASRQSLSTKKYKSGALADGQSIVLTDSVPTDDGLYSLKIGIIYDGTPFEVQDFSIWKFNSSTFKILKNTNGSTRVVTVTGSGDDLTVQNDQGALSMIFTCVVTDMTSLAFN